MTHVDIVPAIYVRLENRPGTLTRAVKALGDSRINVDAVSGETVGDQGFVRILTPKHKEAIDALRRAHVECYESQLVVASLPNRAGELARATAELAAAGINVESVLSTPESKLAFRTSDVERTAQILRKL